MYNSSTKNSFVILNLLITVVLLHIRIVINEARNIFAQVIEATTNFCDV